MSDPEEGRGSATRWIRFEVIFGLLAAALLVFVGLPLLLLLPQVSFSELGDQLARGGLARAIGVSVASASLATLVASCLGVPCGYLLAHTGSRASWAVRGLVVLPTVLPPVAAGVLLLNVYGPAGPVGLLLSGGGWSFVNAFGGVVVAQLFVAAPFVVLTAEASFRSVDPLLEQVSRTLGQTPGRTFLRVALPLARYGVLAGMALAWMRALGEFGATVVMAYHPHTLPVYLWLELTGRGLRGALPVALAALAIAILALALAESLARAGMAVRRSRGTVLRGPSHLGPLEPSAPRRQTASARLSPPPAAGGKASIEAQNSPSGADEGARSPVLDARIHYSVGDFSLDLGLVAGREVVSLFGPSGAGKSTLLRLLAGLAVPDSGRIQLGGVRCHEGGRGDKGAVTVPASARPVGMVFQDSALFPHLDVSGNILFGCREAGPDRQELLAELVALTRLDGLEPRRPHQLSGGQQQRVALARALARRPRVLLLDEPFSSLDFNMKERLHEDVRRIQRAYGLCVVYVTHDLRDACTLGDRLAVISEGRLLQVGPPLEVLRRPADFDVARFVAVRNLLSGVVEESGPDLGRVRCGGTSLTTGSHGFSPGDRVFLCIRPEDIVMIKPDRPLVPPADENVLVGAVVATRLRGATYSLSFQVHDGSPDPGLVLEIELPVRAYDALDVSRRAEWRVSLRRRSLHVIRD